MQLCDPILKVPIEKDFYKRKFIYNYFKKNNFYLIDGFINEDHK